MRFSSLSIICLGGMSLALAGCGQPPEPVFAPSAKATVLVPAAQRLVSESLVENFGTPNKLVAWQQFPINYGAAEPTASDAGRHDEGWRLREGRKLYMVHCLHCHGVAGDGAGPTSRFLNPRPRDYRQGVFKFKSTAGGMKPSTADLHRTLVEGIPGTYMPSFVLLGQEQIGLLADYVKWLSIRGEFEEKLAGGMGKAGATSEELRKSYKDKRESDKSISYEAVENEILDDIRKELPETLTERAQDLTDDWLAGENPENATFPTAKRVRPDAASIARGRELFLSKDVKCSDCHGPAGRGDGPMTEQFIKITDSDRSYDTPGFRDFWGQPIVPRNLTRGVYRFGRRPIDLYRKVKNGIHGTPMPAISNRVTEEQIWDVVNFVMSLPFGGKESASPGEADGEGGEAKVAEAAGS
ncbi:MAG: cytochrome c [Planctomycetota bacterium]|nr:cytochrome c [Planctomycetota bacterium]